MPRVPVYDAPQVARRPLPSVAVRPAESPLPELGRALTSAGAAGADIAKREQELRNADSVFRAEAALTEEYLEFEAGLRQRRGQNAWGVTDDVRQWFDTRGRRYLDDLENDAQRLIFEQTLAKMRERSVSAAAQYEAGERRRSLEESAAASINMAINRAAAQHHDDDAIAEAKRDVLNRIAVQAGFNGWSPERRAAEEELQLTAFHRQVLEAMADTDPERARKYFEANKSEIAGSEHDTLARIVRTGGLRVKAQRETDRLMALGENETETLKRARDEFEGEERDEIVSRIKARFAEQRAAKQQREKEVADTAWDYFARGGNRLDAIPSAVLEELDGRTLQSLRALESGQKVETNWDVYYELRQIAADDPNAFAEADLRRFFGVLAEPERRQLLQLQERVRNPGTALDVATLQQQIATSLRTLNLKDEQRGLFEARVQAEIDAAQQQLGRQLNWEERQTIIDRLLISGEVIGGGLFGLFDPDRRLFQVARDDLSRFEFGIDQIPARDREKIEAALERQGLPVTDERIMAMYRLLLLREFRAEL